MATLVFSSELDCTVAELHAFHSSTEALYALTPRFLNLQVEGNDLSVYAGARFVTWSGIGPIRQKWVAVIEEAGPNGFTDFSEEGPFKEFRHHHRFLPLDDRSILEDEIQYKTGYGTFADFVAGFGIRALFAFRHHKTKKALRR